MDNIGSLDPTGGTRLSDRADQDPFSEVPDGHLNDVEGGILAGGRGTYFRREAYLSPGTPEVYEVHAGQEDKRVYVFSIWPAQCPSHIYETSTSSHGILAEARSAINHLPGRPTDYQQKNCSGGGTI